MNKAGKVMAATVLLVLVLIGTFGDMPFFQAHRQLAGWLGGLDGILFVRLIGLAGVVIACFVAWGYKRKVEASQKYRRAQEVLAAAENASVRKRDSMARLEQTLKEQFEQKEKLLQNEMVQMQEDYNRRLSALKAQNMQLKEAVSKLMGSLKKKGA